MNGLISRQKAIEIIQSMYPGMPRVPWMRKDWQKRYEPYIRMENAIRVLPTAELPIKDKCAFCSHCTNYDVNDDLTIKPTADVVERKKGEWILKKDATGNTYGKCSECGMIQYAGQLNFCPSCGADMRGGKG